MMLHKINVLAFALRTVMAAMLFWTLPASAGSGSGTAGTILMGPEFGSKVFVKIVGTVSGQPSCQVNTDYNIVFDSSTVEGKAMLSLLYLARALGATVQFTGYNTCSLYSTVEDLKWIALKP